MAWLILITVGANIVYKAHHYGRADVADLTYWNNGYLYNL